MTDARVSQLAVEVLRTNLDPDAQVSQLAVEVLRTNLDPDAQVSQLAVEVLRPNAARRLTASAGGLTLSGQIAGLAYVRSIVGAAEAFVLSGQAAGSLRAYIIVATGGGFILTGEDATYSQPGTVAAETGHFSSAGQSALLAYDRAITSSSATFVFTGKTALSFAIYTPAIAETTVLGQTINFLYQDIISDPFFVRESAKALWSITVAQAVAATDAATYAFHPGALINEVVALADAQPQKWNFPKTISESTRLAEALTVAFPVTLVDTPTLASAASVVRAVLVLERLRLIDPATTVSDFYVQLVETLVANDALRRFLGGAVVDTVGIAGTTSYAPILGKVLTDSVGVADTLTKKLIVRVTAPDGVNLDDDTTPHWIFKPVLTDGVEIAIGFLQPNGAFTTWAINTRTGAVTEYQNYEFNSFAQIGHKYLGASSSGLYELNGDDDDGTDIIAHIKSGYLQIGGSKYSSFKAAYLGMRGNGDIILKLETGDGKSYTYQTVIQDMQSTKVQLGKGLRARYFAFELISTGPDFDLDTIEFIPLVAQRRV